MAVVIILFLIFVIMGIIFLFGKGSFLIAGYNTADKKEKEKYDEKKLNLCFACFSFGMAAVIGACGYMDTEAFAVQVGLPAIIALVIFVFIATNTFCKKKQSDIMEKSMSRTGVQRTNEKIGMCRSDSIMFEDFLKNLKNMQVILCILRALSLQALMREEQTKKIRIQILLSSHQINQI